MILRETKISECWCANCHSGQMAHIHNIMFTEKVQSTDLIGRLIKCEKCGHENTLDDIVILMPVEFFVSAESDKSKAKSNDELFKWLRT